MSALLFKRNWKAVVYLSSCGVVAAHFHVLGAETGWRRLTRRIRAKSEVQYCAFEFRTSSNLRQNFYGAVAQDSCDN